MNEAPTIPAPGNAPSEPPAVKLERNRLEALTDWFVAGILGWLLYSGTLQGEIERGVALGGLLTIAGVSGALKALGRGGSASAVIAGAAAKPAVKLAGMMGAAGSRFLACLPLVIALGGCAGNPPSLEHVRIPLDAMGRAMTEHHGKIRAVCELVPPDACRKLVDSFNVLATAQNAAADGVEAIQSVTE